MRFFNSAVRISKYSCAAQLMDYKLATSVRKMGCGLKEKPHQHSCQCLWLAARRTSGCGWLPDQQLVACEDESSCHTRYFMCYRSWGYSYESLQVAANNKLSGSTHFPLVLGFPECYVDQSIYYLHGHCMHGLSVCTSPRICWFKYGQFGATESVVLTSCLSPELPAEVPDYVIREHLHIGDTEKQANGCNLQIHTFYRSMWE